jgi:hypothetical protein
MSQQLHTAMNQILGMGYWANQNARSGGANYGHEAAVADVIYQNGFTELPKSQFPKLTKSLLKKWARSGNDQALRQAAQGMSPGSYILQPAGTQGFPDVLILDFAQPSATARFIAVECKSGKTGLTPMWNDNLPNPDTIYVLSSGKANQTTAFLGRDVITAPELQCQINFMVDVNNLIAQYRSLMAPLDVLNRGWDLKARPQNFQGGGGAKTNYFTHPNRSTCESNVLNFAQL